jgi:hypothetical protein
MLRPRATTVFLLLAAAAILNLAAAAPPAPAADITVFGRPMLAIASAEVLPTPGKESLFPRTFDMKLTVANIGSISASHILMTLPANAYVSLADGSPSFGLNWIGAGESKELTLHMLLDSAEPDGRVQPVFHFEYYKFSEDENLFYTSDEPVRLSFGPQGWNQPVLLVSSCSTTPENPAPGESFTLNMQIANIGVGEARQILVRLGGTDGPAPFSMVGTGNIGSADRVAGLQNVSLKFPLLAGGEAAPGVYPIPVEVDYQNLLGETRTENEVIYLRIRTAPVLQADLITPPPETLLVGQSFDLPFEVINLGRQSMNVGTIELVSDDLTIANGSLYSGPLDPGTSASLPATATAGKAGSATATLVVHYLDEYNRPQTWTQTFTFQIEDAPPAAAQPSATPVQDSGFLDGLWRAIVAFLGFGG